MYLCLWGCLCAYVCMATCVSMSICVCAYVPRTSVVVRVYIMFLRVYVNVNPPPCHVCIFSFFPRSLFNLCFRSCSRFLFSFIFFHFYFDSSIFLLSLSITVISSDCAAPCRGVIRLRQRAAQEDVWVGHYASARLFPLGGTTCIAITITINSSIINNSNIV